MREGNQRQGSGVFADDKFTDGSYDYYNADGIAATFGRVSGGEEI